MAITQQQIIEYREKYGITPETLRTENVVTPYQPTPTDIAFDVIGGILGIIIAIIFLFLAYKIWKLIVKAYKKADRWLEK